MPPQLTLGQLLRKYAELNAAAREEIGDLAAQMDKLLAQVQAIRKPYEDQMAALFEQIKPLAEAELKEADKKSRPFPGGTLKYRSGYTKHNWNNNKLLGYAAAHPEIKAFDEAKEIPSLVTIELD